MSSRAPALFVGHGSPMHAITANPYVPAWSALARRFPRPKAIVCISAHWETDGPAVTTAERPRTIHDFTGFPPELYAIAYPAPGAPELARRIGALTGAQGDTEWGLDHGAWSVLRGLYAGADVPVVQFGLSRAADGAGHYRLGRALAPLRDEGVLILGSGNIVHNLRFFRGPVQRFDWAHRFNDAVKAAVGGRDHAALADYRHLTPDAHLPVPTPEHYLPLLYVLAAQGEDEDAEIVTDDIIGPISMTSVAVGI